MQSAVLSSEVKATEAPATTPESAGTRTLDIRALLHHAAEVIRSGALAARRSFRRYRMDRRRWMIDYQRLEEVREEAFLQMFRNGGLR